MNSLKIVILCLLILPFSIPAQSDHLSKLTGTVYDIEGSVVPGAKVTATSTKGKTYETVTNQEGVYVLTLPFNKYDRKTSWGGEATYDIAVEWNGFKKSETKGYVFIPSQFGKMHFDIALQLPAPVSVSGYR